MIHELKGNRHVRTRAVSVFALSAVFASALASFASLPARENLMSCSMDGRGTPNVFGVCVEFPAESGRPGFYCGEDMTVNYIPCALRNRVGSCEMQSERGPFLVHYYSPQRNGSGLPEFCAQRGKYHAPNSGYTLTLGPSPRKQPDPGKLLEETKEVSSWKESAGSPKEDGLPDKPGGDKSAIRRCSPDAKGSHTQCCRRLLRDWRKSVRIALRSLRQNRHVQNRKTGHCHFCSSLSPRTQGKPATNVRKVWRDSVCTGRRFHKRHAPRGKKTGTLQRFDRFIAQTLRRSTCYTAGIELQRIRKDDSIAFDRSAGPRRRAAKRSHHDRPHTVYLQTKWNHVLCGFRS